jgi:hypothetical protein
MVIRSPSREWRWRRRRRGALATECVVALGLFALAAFPLTFAFLHEARYSRACYYRAATMEIVDGEMEILAAGEWRKFKPGIHAYPVPAAAATNLPAGEFLLSVEPSRLRLEWRPASGRTNDLIRREVELR